MVLAKAEIVSWGRMPERILKYSNSRYSRKDRREEQAEQDE